MNSVDSNEQNLVIGLDCSTTSIKAIAFTGKGEIAGQAVCAIPLSSPQAGYYEQNAEEWWQAAQEALREITRQVPAERILAIAVSNQRETFVALDKHGNSIRPAIVWLDERCRAEVEPFAERIGKRRMHRITGKPVDYAPVVYRLAWMKKHEPALFNKTAMICDVQAFINRKLCGAFKTSWASADPFGMFDMNKKKWSPPILHELNLQPEQLPEPFASATTLGRVTLAVANRTGLGLHTLVVAGGGDGQAAGLGSNVLTSRRAYLNLGTAVVAGVFQANYATDTSFRTMCSCSASGYYLESSLRAGTFSIDWLIRQILKIDKQNGSEIYQVLEREAEEIAPGCEGLLHLPYLCGAMNPYWDEKARAAFVGISSFHQRGYFYRALLEGIALELLLEISSIEKTIGRTVREFITIGGGAKSRLWCRIVADVTGKNVCLPKNTEASSLGAAIMAAVGSGLHSSFARAAQQMTGINEIIRPEAKNHKRYSPIFSKYARLYPALKKAGV